MGMCTDAALEAWGFGQIATSEHHCAEQRWSSKNRLNNLSSNWDAAAVWRKKIVAGVKHLKGRMCPVISKRSRFFGSPKQNLEAAIKIGFPKIKNRLREESWALKINGKIHDFFPRKHVGTPTWPRQFWQAPPNVSCPGLAAGSSRTIQAVSGCCRVGSEGSDLKWTTCDLLLWKRRSFECASYFP